MVIWRKLETFEARATLESWSWRFCQLELANRVQKTFCRKAFAGPTLEEVSDGQVQHQETPSVEYDHLEASLQALGPPEEEVVRLKHFEHLMFDEISTSASDMEAVPGLDSIEATIEGLAAQGQSKSWNWLWIAAGLLLILALMLWPDREPKIDELLGNGAGQVQFVNDGSGQHGALELEKLPSGAHEMLLLVYDAEDPSAVACRPPILLNGQRYSDPSEQQLWPRNARVEVVIRRPMKDDEVVGSATYSLD